MDDDTAVEVSIIRRQLNDGELPYIDAIMWLERVGIDPKDAEQMVIEWEKGEQR